jgi:Uma2 family endonuclease
MSLQVAKNCLTVAEYNRMSERGILNEDDRLELIQGEIIQMSPIGSRHAACVKFISRLVNQTLGDVVIVGTQDPIQLDDFSQPQPDIALLRLRDDFYRHAHPMPADVLLIIEVSDTTIVYDRLAKIPLYANAGIAEVWLVNLGAEQIELFAHPAGDAYETTIIFKRGDEARSQTLSGLNVNVADAIG